MSISKKLFTYSIVVILTSVILGGCSYLPGRQSQLFNPFLKEKVTSRPQTIPTPPQAHEKMVKVALLLPLSGPSKDLGRSMLDAAQLALFNAGATHLQLLPLDTENGPGAASEAARQAIAQGAKIIIGPVFSKSVAAVTPIARAQHMNIISFSNNQALKGEGVFLIGFMPDQQIKRVMRYSLVQGKTDFYALAPANAYGKMAIETLTSSLADTQGTVIKTEFYPEDAGDGLELSVKSIGNALVNTMNEPGKAERSALLIPEGGEHLDKIATQLAQLGVDFKRVKLIGSGQWDDESTRKMPLLLGGWFAGASPEQHALFEQQFMAQYGYKPVRIVSLSYDAVALVAALLSDSGKDLSSTALTSPQGFIGVDGIFRLRKDGISERGLSVLQITDKDFQVVDPAPTAFETK